MSSSHEVDLSRVSARLPKSVEKLATPCYRVLCEKHVKEYATPLTVSQFLAVCVVALHENLKKQGLI